MRDTTTGRQRGMTLLELLVGLAILMLTVLIGFPALQKTIARAQLEGTAQEMMAVMRQARLEAVKRSRPVVVVLEAGEGRMRAFIDFHDALGAANSDLLFTPKAGVPELNTDYIVSDVRLGKNVEVGGPVGDALPVDGFTDRGDGPRAVFNSDGSVTDVGAFRIHDTRDNFLEIRAEPAATGRLQLRKWLPTDNAWHTRDMRNGKVLWEWY
jgi:prepilin-type N-terminal cleavage/methylation domain-containing protein